MADRPVFLKLQEVPFAPGEDVPVAWTFDSAQAWLSGASLAVYVRTTQDGTPADTLTVGDGVTVDSTTVFTSTVPASLTEGLTSDAFLDAWRTDAGYVRRLGRVKLKLSDPGRP